MGKKRQFMKNNIVKLTSQKKKTQLTELSKEDQEEKKIHYTFTLL
jgi:hypothetical protein